MDFGSSYFFHSLRRPFSWGILKTSRLPHRKFETRPKRPTNQTAEQKIPKSDRKSIFSRVRLCSLDKGKILEFFDEEEFLVGNVFCDFYVPGYDLNTEKAKDLESKKIA